MVAEIVKKHFRETSIPAVLHGFRDISSISSIPNVHIIKPSDICVSSFSELDISSDKLIVFTNIEQYTLLQENLVKEMMINYPNKMVAISKTNNSNFRQTLRFKHYKYD